MSDAVLLRFEVTFRTASDRWDAATAKTARFDKLSERIKARHLAAEQQEGREADAVGVLFERIMNTRATSLAGLLVKVRVRERWNIDDERSEITILQSLIADLKAIEEAQQ